MEGSRFDEDRFFSAVEKSPARALLIGRRAVIAFGIPVLTGDYDYWIHIDDIAAFNETAAPFDLRPNRSPDAARKNGRYKLEGDEGIDVLVARAVPTVDGVRVAFDDVWARHTVLWYTDRIRVKVPCIDDLILTKRFGARTRDADDIRLLEELKKYNP